LLSRPTSTTALTRQHGLFPASQTYIIGLACLTRPIVGPKPNHSHFHPASDWNSPEKPHKLCGGLGERLVCQIKPFSLAPPFLDSTPPNGYHSPSATMSTRRGHSGKGGTCLPILSLLHALQNLRRRK